jgi:membrane protease YdiL (CAAX protease family)
MTVHLRRETPGTSLRRTPLRYLAVYYVILIAAWVGAWYLHDLTSIRDFSPGATFAYWTLAKLIVWIAPVLLIVSRALGQSPMEYLGFVRVRRGAAVGLAVGAVFVALMAVVDAFTRSHALPDLTWPTLNALVAAPLSEELVFRGFALKALEDSGWRFWPANGIAAVLFLGLHLPGWQFTRGLNSSAIVLGLNVAVVGLVAGYARHRARSTWASVTVHFLNNSYSAFLR